MEQLPFRRLRQEAEAYTKCSAHNRAGTDLLKKMCRWAAWPCTKSDEEQNDPVHWHEPHDTIRITANHNFGT